MKRARESSLGTQSFGGKLWSGLVAFLCFCGSLFGAELPSAPASHLYDPDFFISRAASQKLSRLLQDFETRNGFTIYLAVFTATPRLLEETARDLNESWNQSGYGVVIVFAPQKQEAQVLPSPELSLLQSGQELSAVFRRGAGRGLARGDYSAAASEGTEAVLRSLRVMRARIAAPAESGWHPSRLTKSAVAAGLFLALLVFLWIAGRVWRSANLFDRRYRFAQEPARLRLGGSRCGGQMATMHFAPNEKPKP